MQGKPASIMLLFLLVVSTIVLAHNVQPVKSDYACGRVEASSLGDIPIPAISWTVGNSFPVVNGHTIFPTLAPNVSQASSTHWYAGSVSSDWFFGQNARTIYVSIRVPYSAPRSDEFYYVLLSAWTASGIIQIDDSYVQIGFSDCFGTWGLAYSWTSGPIWNQTFHYSPNAMTLSEGATYTFYITTQNGLTYFTAYQDLTYVWSLVAPTGGDYLWLHTLNEGCIGYTNYEEVWQTSTPGGSPAFDFYFFNNRWVSLNGQADQYTSWWAWSDGAPSNVAVTISGNNVLVNNPMATVLFETNPTLPGATITFGGSAYTNGQSATFYDSYYSALAAAPSGYQFDHWEYSGDPGSGVYVPDTMDNPTIVQVRGDGWLDAILARTALPRNSYNADSMWVDPTSTVFNSNVSVGQTFNVTAWMNITENVCAYEIALHYNRTQLKCTRAGFTDGVTSNYFAGHTTFPAGPNIDTGTLGNGTVFAGESCVGNDFISGPKSASLIWAEFQILLTPIAGQTMNSTFDISTEYPSYTFVLDPNLNNINITPYDGNYQFTCPPATVYIMSDGSVVPSYAPISSIDNVTYTFTGNVSYPTYEGIVVERNNTVIDGNRYTVQGNQSGDTGLSLTGVSNVTIKNTNIKGFQNGIYLSSSNSNIINGNNATANSQYGIYLYFSSCNTVSGNNATANTYGIWLSSSSNNTISGNNATANIGNGIFLVSSSNNTVSANKATANNNGIYLFSSSNNNTVSGNNATANGFGICLYSSSENIISGNNATANSADGVYLGYSSWITITANNIANNNDSIYLYSSSNNSLSGNNIANNGYGICLYSSSNSTIYYNNIINNTSQVYSSDSTNVWDDGYPSGGNYWSDYNGKDLYSGPYQSMTGSDGISDTPYLIDANNQDNYPLMKPYPWAAHDIGITNIATSKNIVGQGYGVSMSMMVFNYGNGTEDVNVTVYANQTMIGGIFNVELTSRNFTIVPFTWNTTGFAKGNCILWAYAEPVSGEISVEDNTLVDGWIKITIVGDVNGDGKVNLIDVFAVALAYGSYPGHPAWNPSYDINNDGKINLIDYFITALNYGKTDP